METKKITSFRDLVVWQESHKLVVIVYELTKKFPKEELYGLVAQIRRAAVSITSNIAEGFSRQSIKEKVQFYSMAHGSLTEVENQLLVARDVHYIEHKDFNEIFEQVTKVHKLLNGFIKKTKERQPASFQLPTSNFYKDA